MSTLLPLFLSFGTLAVHDTNPVNMSIVRPVHGAFPAADVSGLHLSGYLRFLASHGIAASDLLRELSLERLYG